MKRRLIIPAVGAALVATALIHTTTVQADPWNHCGLGAQVTNNLGLAVDGVPATLTSIDGVPAVFDDKYNVNVCRELTQTQSYIIYLADDTNTVGHRYLTEADADKTFTVSFTPTMGDKPLVVEGHARIQAFSVDAANENRVTVSLKPIAWSDIWSNDCNAGNNPSPDQCIAHVVAASEDISRDIRVGVRFSTPTKSAAGFDNMQGMTWSASAFFFWMSTDCPFINTGASDGITFVMGGPHFKRDGSTVNYGYASVYMPASVVFACFGATPAAFVPNLAMSRTENGRTVWASTASQTAGLQYTLSATDSGLTISVPEVTFSKPVYKVKTRTGKTLVRSSTALSVVVVSAKIIKPLGGKTTVVVSSTAKNVCKTYKTKLYSFAKGKVCRYTVTSYKKSGVKYKSVSKAFVVR